MNEENLRESIENLIKQSNSGEKSIELNEFFSLVKYEYGDLLVLRITNICTEGREVEIASRDFEGIKCEVSKAIRELMINLTDVFVEAWMSNRVDISVTTSPWRLSESCKEAAWRELENRSIKRTIDQIATQLGLDIENPAVFSKAPLEFFCIDDIIHTDDIIKQRKVEIITNYLEKIGE